MSLIATGKLAKTVGSQAVWLAWEPRRFQLHPDDSNLSGTNVDPSLGPTSRLFLLILLFIFSFLRPFLALYPIV